MCFYHFQEQEKIIFIKKNLTFFSYVLQYFDRICKQSKKTKKLKNLM